MSSKFQILNPSYDPATGIALFPYALGDLRFTELLEFPAGADADAAASDAFLKLLDLTAVVLGVSYFKLLAPTRIEADQAARLGRILKMMGDAGYFRVILIHHPPNLEARHPRLGLRGSKLFRAAVAENGAELVLHGHTHKSTIYAIPGKLGDVPVVGVAAAGAAQSEDGGEDPARYNLFKIERLGTAWSCTMREFGFQRLSTDIVLRLSLRIY